MVFDIQEGLPIRFCDVSSMEAYLTKTSEDCTNKSYGSLTEYTVVNCK